MCYDEVGHRNRKRSRISRIPMALFFVMSLALLGSGCLESPTAEQGQNGRMDFSQRAEEEIAAAVQGRQLRGIEDEILRLEEKLPGLGGVFMNGNGALVIYGPADSSASSVRSIVAQQSSGLHIRDELRQRLASGDRVEVLPAQFAFSRLVAWQDALANQTGPGDGIIALDADEAANRVTVRVRDTDASSRLIVLANAMGIPSDAIRIRLEGYPASLGTLRDKIRPMGAGIQIVNQNSARCTLGFNATTTTGISGFITASHCAPGTPGLGHTGSYMYQPAKSLWNYAGYILDNPPFNYSSPACGSYTRCTIADVMMVQHFFATHDKKMIQTSSVGTNNTPGSITVSSSWYINLREFYPLVGETIDKMGRSTGWTRGTIANTCETMVVDSTSPNAYRQVCAFRVDSASAGQGDSGGPVFNYQNGYIYGSLYAGGPLNAYDSGDGFYYCNANCSYYFSGFLAMTTALGYTPIPH